METPAMFQPTVTRTSEWIHDLMQELGLDDAHVGLRALRAGMHAVRDRLPVNEAAGLGAGLPALLRGFYYEGWHPDDDRQGRTCRELYAEAQRELGDGVGITGETLVRATLRVLARRFSAGDFGDPEGCLSRRLGDLWTGTLR